MTTTAHLFLCCLLLGASLAAAGCGDKKSNEAKINVKGKLVENGKPFTFDANKMKLPPGTSAPPVAPGGGGGMVQILFIPAAGGDATYGKLDAAVGTFEASGLPPGRYKIAITVGNLPAGATDPFGGKFTQEKTQIVRDLKEGEEITIDVAKPQG